MPPTKKMSAANLQGVVRSENLLQVDPMSITIREGFNPRSEFNGPDMDRLKASILVNGVLQPITVFQAEGYLLLIDGERRVRAVRSLISDGHPIKTMPAILARDKGKDDERLIIALSANDSTPLSPMDEANAFERLMKYGWTVKEISDRLARQEAYIYSKLDILKAEPELRRELIGKKASVTQILKAIHLAEKEDISQKEALNTLKNAPDLRTATGKARKAAEKEQSAVLQAAAQQALIHAEAEKLAQARMEAGEKIPATTPLLPSKTPVQSKGQGMQAKGTLPPLHTGNEVSHVLPPDAYGQEVTDDEFSDLPGADYETDLKARGLTREVNESPWNRLSAEMSSVVATPGYTLEMILLWLYQRYSEDTILSALDTAVTSDREAASKAIPGSIGKIMVPVLGAAMSAQAALVGDAPVTPTSKKKTAVKA